jgi:acetyltransferase-like isoleucine patch superfamily enzyme
MFQGGKQPVGIEYGTTSIAPSVSIGAGAVIGRGAVLLDGVVVDHQCIVESNATVGRNTLLIYRAIVGGDAVIGSDCVIGGFVAEGVSIGNGCRVFGQLIHKQVDTSFPWDEHETPEPSATIGDHSFVGFSALLIGGVRIGPQAYVCAGAIVTRDVPTGCIAFGVNRVVPASEWQGQLSANPTLTNTKSGR